MRNIANVIYALGLSLIPGLSWGQAEVSGRVWAGEVPLPGVSVYAQEAPQTGTYTDAGGRYSLSLPAGAETLVFAMTGYARQEVPLSGRRVVDITLRPVDFALQEVVIAAVGIEKEKQAVGYALQTLESAALVNAREPNLVNALNAKVAGVQVTSTSGSPGASANIVIRGRASLNNNAPLFVVDGVPVSNEYAGSNFIDHANRAIDLNPDDIASLTVLKGPAATALYGVRAANGAIVITTKKGGQGRISFKQGLTWDQVNKLPRQQQLFGQGDVVQGVPTYLGPLGSNRSWGARLDTLRYDGDHAYPFSRQGRIVGMRDPTATANPVTPFDNAGQFFQTGITSNTHLSVSGGAAGTTYYLSSGLLSQTGVIPNATWQRFTLKAAGETQVNDRLKVSSSVNYIRSGGNRMQRGSNLSGVMLGLMRAPVSFDLANGSADPVHDPQAYQFADGSPRRYWDAYDNPFWSVNRNLSRDQVNRLIGNAQVTYELLPWLRAMYRAGLDYYFEERKSYWDNQSNEFGTGVIFDDLYSFRSFNSDFLLTADKSLSEKLRLTASVGHNYLAERGLNSVQEGERFIIPGFFDISNVAQVTFADDAIRERRIVGAFYDVQIGYDGWLFFNTTGRFDWASTLPMTENPFFYDAYNLGLVFSEGLKLPAEGLFSYGKLRLSVARVGGDARPYSLNTFYSLSGPVKGQTAFLQQGTIGNAGLRPEETLSYEGGLDLRFFQNRLGLDLTVYRSESRDQIISVPIAFATGYAFQIANAGVIRNVGVEALLSATPVRRAGWQWDIVANFSANENTVIELAEGVNDIRFEGAGVTSTANRAIPGQPFGVLYGTRWLRNEAGQVLVNEAGYPLFDPQEPGIVGDPNPDWLLGLRNSLSFRGWYVSCLLDVRKGGDIYNGTVGVMKNLGVHASTEAREEEVVVEGVYALDGSPNTTPIRRDAAYYGRYPFAGVSEENVEDGSWIRLREITLTYTLPAAWLDRSPLSSLELGLNVRNAFLFTRYSGVDPETNLAGATNSFGRDWFNSPNTRSFGVQVSLGF